MKTMKSDKTGPAAPQPSALLLTQLRALAAGNLVNETRTQALVDRYLGACPDTEARGAALLSTLLGRPFQPAALRGPSSVMLRTRLNEYAPLFDCIASHLQGLGSVPPPLAAESEQQQTHLVSGPEDELVVTVVGEVTRRAAIPNAWVAFTCASCGNYPAHRWEVARPELQVLAPWLTDAAVRRAILPLIFSQPDTERTSLAQALVELLQCTAAHADLRERIFRHLGGVSTGHATGFAYMCSQGFLKSKEPGTVEDALADFTALDPQILSAALSLAKNSPAHARWVAAIARSLLGGSSPAQSASVWHSMLNLGRHGCMTDEVCVRAMVRALKPLPEDRQALVTDIVLSMQDDQTDQATLVRAFSAPCSASVASMAKIYCREISAICRTGDRRQAADDFVQNVAYILALNPANLQQAIHCGASSSATALWVLSVAKAQADSRDPVQASATAAMLKVLPEGIAAAPRLAGAIAGLLHEFPCTDHDSLLSAAQTATQGDESVEQLAKIMRALAMVERGDRRTVVQRLGSLLRVSMSAETMGELIFGVATLAPEVSRVAVPFLAPLLTKHTSLPAGFIGMLFDGVSENDACDAPAFIATVARLLSPGTEELLLDVLRSLNSHAWRTFDQLSVQLAPDTLPRVVVELSAVAGAQRGHILDCMKQLMAIHSPGDCVEGPAMVVVLAALNDVVSRQFAVTHLVTLGIGPPAASDGVQQVIWMLRDRVPERRVALLATAQKLMVPTMAAEIRVQLMLLLQAMATEDLADFVGACRWGDDNNLIPQPDMARILLTHERFQRGIRTNPHGIVDTQSVHRATVTTALTDSVMALLSMRLPATALPPTYCAVRDYITALERLTPATHILRRKRPGHTRTTFDEARFAFSGGRSTYPNFISNADIYNLPDGRSIGLGTLAALVWRAIAAYPANAISPPTDPDAVERDKETMRYSYVMQLAKCVEDNVRVCYAGKAAQSLQSLQGFIRGIDLDRVEEAEPVPIPAGTILSTTAEQEFSGVEDPTLQQVEKFVGRMFAEGESTWPNPASPERQKLMRDLQQYVEADHEIFAEAHPNFWLAPI
jgi:hypothetical protein